MKRLMISAPSSGAGKTTLTMGFIRVLMRRGLSVSTGKIGPDYIDPMYHRALGGDGYNLDSFLMEEDYIRALLYKMEKKDIVLMEGAMGYYDGIFTTTEGSCAEMSVLTDTPTILVTTGKGKGASLGAEIKGFLDFAPNRIVGVILNETKPMLLSYYEKIIEDSTGLPLLGCIPSTDIQLSSRHLGLLRPQEVENLKDYADYMADLIEKYVDVEKVLNLAEVEPTEVMSREKIHIGKVKVAIAKDEAFQFYYRDVLEDFGEVGVEWIPFSPLRDSLPKGISGLYLGGGYPELYKDEISAGTAFKEELRDYLNNGHLLIAECGGYMSLLESIDGTRTWDLLPGEAIMTDSLKNFGYHYMKAKDDGLLMEAGEEIAVHEFHYGKATVDGEGFTMKKAGRNRERKAGFHGENFYAGFPHLHLSGNHNLRRRILMKLKEAKPWQGLSY